MATVADLYNESRSPQLEPKSPPLPYFTTVYGRRVHENKVCGPAYWQLNTESTVLFRIAVTKLLAELAIDCLSRDWTAFCHVWPIETDL